MTRLEDELRNALRRENPPEDFAAKVLARAAEQAWARRPWWPAGFELPRLRWAAAAVLCLILAVAGLEYWNARTERTRGEKAKAQLMLALRITGSKLQLAQHKVQEIQTPGTDRN